MENNNNKKNTLYLVTGVAGNLGSSVAAKLLEEGNRVRGLVLKGDPAAVRVPREVDICVGDVTDTESLERFFEADYGTDIAVIHCAADVPPAQYTYRYKRSKDDTACRCCQAYWETV